MQSTHSLQLRKKPTTTPPAFFSHFFYRSLINYLTLMLECRNEKRALSGLSFLGVCLLFVIVYLLTKLERHLCTPKTNSVALCFFRFFLSLSSLCLYLCFSSMIENVLMLFYLNRDSTTQTNCDLALDWCEIILIIIVATIDIILINYFHARYLFVRLYLYRL